MTMFNLRREPRNMKTTTGLAAFGRHAMAAAAILLAGCSGDPAPGGESGVAKSAAVEPTTYAPPGQGRLKTLDELVQYYKETPDRARHVNTQCATYLAPVRKALEKGDLAEVERLESTLTRKPLTFAFTCGAVSKALRSAS